MPSFETIVTPVPVKPAALELVLNVRQAADGSRTYEGTFHFAIPTSDDREIERRRGNLVPHLTAAQITALRNFLDTMLDKARAVVP